MFGLMKGHLAARLPPNSPRARDDERSDRRSDRHSMSPEDPDTPSRSDPLSRDSPTRSDPLGLPAGFLKACAARWPMRAGGRALQHRAGPDAYARLLTVKISQEDADQIRMDVERSSVDGLEELFPESLDALALCEALSRLLHAWCARRPNGYCQGTNFVAMVLLVVFLREASASAGSDAAAAHRSEETAFWTFVAVMELILPDDFYAHPRMPGLQREVRTLFSLLELVRVDQTLAELESWRDSNAMGWRDVVRLAAYKWLVPCYVNMLPLPTLLLYWDRLFLRGAHRASADGGGGGGGGGGGVVVGGGVAGALTVVGNGGPSVRVQYEKPAAHLLLAIALIRIALAESTQPSSSGSLSPQGLHSRSEEGLALGFNELLETGMRQTDAGELLSLAASVDVTVAQFAFMRTCLEDAPASPAGMSAVTDTGRPPRHPEPFLSPLQTTKLRLMGRSDALPVRLLKLTILLYPPAPPPFQATEHTSFYYPRLVSTCALTATAVGVWAMKALWARMPSRPGSTGGRAVGGGALALLRMVDGVGPRSLSLTSRAPRSMMAT